MYITKYNLDLLIGGVDSDDSSNTMSSVKIENFDYLSPNEKEKLKKGFFFFKTIGSNDPIKFKPIEREDSKKYIFKENYPAFHKNKDCERLKARWSNFYLPGEVKAQGDIAIAKFRKIVINQMSKPEGLQDPAFILSLKIQFNISDTNFGREDKDNSSSVNFSNEIEILSLEDAQEKIKFFSDQLDNFPQKSELHKKVFQMRYWDVTKIRRIERNRSAEEKEVANNLATLKANLIVAIMMAYQYENSFDLNDIEEEILLSLNFRKCSFCFKDDSPSFSNTFKEIINNNMY